MERNRTEQEEHIAYLLQRYGDLMYHMSYAIVGNSADAEDMVQDSFLTYMQEAPEFPDEASEKQWLVKVVRNQSLMYVRKTKNRERILSENARVHVGTDADYGILDVLQTLPEKYRTVLVLFYVEEYSVEQIAGILGKSLSAVKMRLQRGRKLLAERYEVTK